MFNLFKAIKSGAKRLAGKALEVVGEKIPGPIGDKLQDIGWDLQYGKTGLSASSSLQETFDAAAECLKNCNAAMDKAAPLIHEIVEIAKNVLTIAILNSLALSRRSSNLLLAIMLRTIYLPT